MTDTPIDRESVERCAECDCQHGGIYCNWIKSPYQAVHDEMVALRVALSNTGEGEGLKLPVFTQADFDDLPVVDGYRICPSGDYSQIKGFPNGCRFGASCRFGEWCSFGASCRFGEGCSFGDGCRFAIRSSFGASCRFGEWCSFGEGCRFGEWCRFGASCRFGEWCSFEGNYLPADWQKPYFAVDRIGSEHRKAYFFNFTEGGIHVRAGCFFGDRAAFLAKLHADGDPVKTRHYEAALALAEMILTEGIELARSGRATVELEG